MFFEHELHESNESFRLRPVYIRGIREIRGQLNIIHTRICFSNTNRTNLTNLVGCDMVCIRGIREIRGQTNKIHTRIYIFFEH